MKKVCETCNYYLCRESIHSIDCLNENLPQEEYERCLGENGENCEGWKSEEELKIC